MEIEKEIQEQIKSNPILLYMKGLGVNAGHDLNLFNLKQFLTKCEIDEVSIGHALISDALRYGMQETIVKYLQQCK